MIKRKIYALAVLSFITIISNSFLPDTAHALARARSVSTQADVQRCERLETRFNRAWQGCMYVGGVASVTAFVMGITVVGMPGAVMIGCAAGIAECAGLVCKTGELICRAKKHSHQRNINRNLELINSRASLEEKIDRASSEAHSPLGSDSPLLGEIRHSDTRRHSRAAIASHTAKPKSWWTKFKEIFRKPSERAISRRASSSAQ